MPEGKTVRGACHCRAVKFEVALKGGLSGARRCNCSMCRMRGAVALTADVGDLRLVEGEEQLTEYRFNTGVARHYFCSRCGIYTHHQRRSNPNEFGVNAACLEGVSPFDFREVPVTDGVRHTSDGNPERIVGVLRFEPE
ncbi:MAG TPA: GFA family protein [Phenylobacterium sp.]|uniref:GFA family protein n=1 Tax=Phenylobacterium sp. TaxID=1871053 RepID=UPI002B466778|nr:GFA family protein [Phenylobacterium sp.]HKR88576.1 GFA family protein [Phenylobacterium sp.]